MRANRFVKFDNPARIVTHNRYKVSTCDKDWIVASLALSYRTAARLSNTQRILRPLCKSLQHQVRLTGPVFNVAHVHHQPPQRHVFSRQTCAVDTAPLRGHADQPRLRHRSEAVATLFKSLAKREVSQGVRS